HTRVPVDPGPPRRRPPHRLRGAGQAGGRTSPRGRRGGGSRRRPRLPPAEGGLPLVSRRVPALPARTARASRLRVLFAAAIAIAATAVSPAVPQKTARHAL